MVGDLYAYNRALRNRALDRRLVVEGEPPVILEQDDFVLLPATPAFTMSSIEPAVPRHVDPRQVDMSNKAIRHGRSDGPPDMRQFGGYFAFESPDAALLVTLLPRMIHIRGAPRLTQLVQLVKEEFEADALGRELVLERLVEILLIEALRSVPAETARPGLLRGLSEPRIAAALREIHADARRAWTVRELARTAGMSRSAFFERFTDAVGVRPMEYLLGWRMAVAKDLLRAGGIALDDVAHQVGYGSASTFSTAFSRHAGMPPGRFMRMAGAAGPAAAR